MASSKIECCNNVLIVDDESMNLRVIRSNTKNLGFNFIEATNGYDALKIFMKRMVDKNSCTKCYNFKAIISDLNISIYEIIFIEEN